MGDDFHDVLVEVSTRVTGWMDMNRAMEAHTHSSDAIIPVADIYAIMKELHDAWWPAFLARVARNLREGIVVATRTLESVTPRYSHIVSATR